MISLDCSEQTWGAGSLKISSVVLGNGDCAVSILPNSSGLHFREFLFSSSGLFKVFISTEGPEKTSTGSRNYFLFPRKQGLGFVENSSGSEFSVVLSNGEAARFSTLTGALLGVSGSVVTEDPRVALDNYGGVEFKSVSGVLLDTGWQIYDPAFDRKDRQSLFRDSKGNYCPVINSEIFSYSGEPQLKFATDAELAVFLRARCPTLDLSALE